MPPEVKVLTGDCLEVMKTLEENSVDAVLSDPPYGLSFMGKQWDHGVPGVPFWEEALRVLKPGGYILAFGGTRTFHRLTVAIEDAGFEIRDCLSWLYGSGFPKSHNVSKAIVNRLGETREVIGLHPAPATPKAGTFNQSYEPAVLTAPATDEAKQWDGWGTALKPSWEPIILARKPLEGTVAANVLEYGTGGLNIDGCRIGGGDTRRMCGTTEESGQTSIVLGAREETSTTSGRWPANTLFDREAADLLDEQSGETKSSNAVRKNTAEAHNKTGSMGKSSGDWATGGHADQGGASRFFYVAKPSKAERNAGLEGFDEKAPPQKYRMSAIEGDPRKPAACTAAVPVANVHPTVKPIELMRYLARLITPPGGTIMDPFMGSGSTGCAAVLEGFGFIGIDKEPEYAEIAKGRIAYWQSKGKTDLPVKKLLPKKPAKKKSENLSLDLAGCTEMKEQ